MSNMEGDVRLRDPQALPSDACAAAIEQLLVGLEDNIKDAVMAAVELIKRGTDMELGLWPLRDLFESSLLEDEEVVRAILSVVPRATFGMRLYSSSCLDLALAINHPRRELAIDLCLEHQPPMKEMLEGRQLFWYVNVAAELCDVETVQRMHDLLPLLEDGSGRRGESTDYAFAMQYASTNRRQRTGVWPIMAYLVEQAGGSSILEECNPLILMNVRQVEDVEWLVAQSTDLVEAACRQEDCLDTLLCCLTTSKTLLDYISKLVDRETIGKMMRGMVTIDTRRRYGAHGWRWKLKELHRGLPECLDGLRWRWLMQAIEDKAYADVWYMSDLCGREHLVMRNKDGDTAYDVAVKDEAFPRDLLDRLNVIAKGAHA